MSTCHCGRPSQPKREGVAPGREDWCQDCNDYRCDLPGDDGYRCDEAVAAAGYRERMGRNRSREERLNELRDNAVDAPTIERNTEETK